MTYSLSGLVQLDAGRVPRVNEPEGHAGRRAGGGAEPTVIEGFSLRLVLALTFLQTMTDCHLEDKVGIARVPTSESVSSLL